jgi:hypothetical protein
MKAIGTISCRLRVLTVLLLFPPVALGVTYAAVARADGFARSDRERAVERAKARVTALLPAEMGLTGSSEITEYPCPGGLPRKVWLTDLSDSSGLPAAAVVLDDATGDVVTIVMPWRRGAAGCGAMVDRAEAIADARHWMEKVFPGTNASAWRVNGPPSRRESVWRVFLGLERCHVRVDVDARSGYFLSLWVSPCERDALRQVELARGGSRTL